MAKRHVDSLKAKQKKQKIILAVLGVVFLGVLGFQGPRTWKQLHPAPGHARAQLVQPVAHQSLGSGQ